jgi:hypothetical protein
MKEELEEEKETKRERVPFVSHSHSSRDLMKRKRVH